MQIGDWKSSKDLNDVYKEARDLGLESNIAELEAYGYTVVENLISNDLTDRATEAILRVAGERAGKIPDPETAEGFPGIQLQMRLLMHDRVFEEILMTDSILALLTYLLGKNCLLSSLSSHLKGPGALSTIPLHCDTGGSGVPAPLPPYALVGNCNIALTAYTEPDDGGLGIVPGSHKWCRYPLPNEMDLAKNKQVVPVIVPKGSAIVWHGNTFHGSFVRKKPGFRINLAMYFNRRFMMTQENFGDAVPRDMLERNNKRFASLMGMNVKHLVGEDEKVDYAALMASSFPSQSQYS